MPPLNPGFGEKKPIDEESWEIGVYRQREGSKKGQERRGNETDLWWFEGIVVWELDIEEKDASSIRRICSPTMSDEINVEFV